MKGFRPKTPAEREPYLSPKQESAAWTRYFRGARRLGRSWEGCMACPPERRDPTAILDVHHVVAQQFIKAWAKDHGWSAFRLLEVLTDPRNSMLIDGGCHHRHTVLNERLPRSAVRPYAWTFAREHGWEEHVMEEYPR